MKAAFEGISNQDPVNTAPLRSYPSPSGATPPLRTAGPATVAKPKVTKSQASTTGEVRLDVSNVYKIFSDNPKPALDMLYAGATKDEVFKKLGVTVGVKDASFQVRSGEIFVIMGLSGSGKSTMVRLLNRLIEPSAGKIVFDGRDLVTMSRKELIAVRRKDMSMVFQSFALMPHLTALDNAAFGLEIAGVPKPKRHEAAMEALKQVGLDQYHARYPREMPGGMQQRVGLARALANNPTIMLMDEAFSALDPLIRTEMQDELLRLQREHKRTIIFISHDLDEAMRIGDRIAIMEGGNIVQVGTPFEILRNPADAYVSSFFRNVDVSRVLRAGDVARFEEENTVIRVPGVLQPALEQLTETRNEYGYVRDHDNRYHGTVSRDSLERAITGEGQPRFVHAFLPDVDPVHAEQPLHDVMRTVASAECPVPVVDDENKFLGAISPSTLLKTLNREK
jgi:glycine betaine/proline transport system ATP-binding protein